MQYLKIDRIIVSKIGVVAIFWKKYILNVEKNMDTTRNKIDATLIFLVRGESGRQKVLLARKVRKLIINCYNGFGGSLNKRETPRACAVRELYKESGLVALKEDLEFVGVMTFYNKREKKDGGGEFAVRVFIFILKKWRGKLKLKEDEMRDVRWFKTYRLPSDRFWVPLILNGEYKDKLLRGEAWHSPQQKRLLEISIKCVGKTSDVD
jgi:8-oxo-dGTP diphosphatase